MNRPRASLFFLLFFLLAILVAAPGTTAGPGEEGDRAATYPPEVAKITHSPGSPVRGDDVTITLRLAPGADAPELVSIIWCRVEPDYVCAAIPPLMTSRGDGVWTGTIPGAYGGEQDVIKHDTVHVGYNLTLRYAEGRVYAPLSSHAGPESFPADADGRYYFIAYADPGRALPPAPLVLLLVFALTACGRRITGGADNGH